MFIEISNVKKHFGEGDSRVDVLKGIDIEVEKGEICVLLGPSGSGKSTLLNIIGGIDEADEGQAASGRKFDEDLYGGTFIMGLSSAQAKGRIKNIASKNGAGPRVLMRIYMMERFLERVSLSDYKDNFIIKGGLLITSIFRKLHNKKNKSVLFSPERGFTMADSSIYELTQKWCESQNRSIYSLYKNEDGLLKESTFESIKKGNNPEYETLKIIANELHVSLSDFFKGPGDVTVLTDKERIVVESMRSVDSATQDMIGSLALLAKMFVRVICGKEKTC